VRVAFALDRHDREVSGWVATTGISSEMIRDMMVQCVEERHRRALPQKRWAPG
jgi:putative transposase